MIAEMKKVVIAIPRSQREELLQFLQEESVIHLIEHDELLGSGETEITDTAYHLAQLQCILDFIARIKKELGVRSKRSLKNIFAGKPVASLRELEKVTVDLQIPALIATVEKQNDTLASIDARLLAIQGDIAMLIPWASLQLHAQDDAMGHSVVIHHLLAISIKNEDGIIAGLASVPTAMWQVVYRDVQKNTTTVYGELIAHRNDAVAVKKFEEELDAKVVTLPIASEESIAGKYEVRIREQRMLEKKRVTIIMGARSIVEHEREIMFAYDALLHREERERASNVMQRSEYSVVCSGWIPALWISLFTKRLARAFPSAVVEATKPELHSKAPVLFQNNSFIQPFEVVTDLYGKPAYHEVDPTGPLALFFLISFSLALTDAGYGIVMMLVTYIALQLLRLKKDMQKMMKLLFFGGAMTVFLGALTGGWFSINLDTLPVGPIQSFLLSIKLLDPLKQPMLLLGIIFGFGILQLVYAWIVRGMYHWKKGEKNVASMDDFSWVALVSIIIISIASSRGLLLVSFAVPLKWLTYGALLFMVATQGRASRNIFLRVGLGVLSLNGLISFVSDMLSYSRLLALGLATGIIGLVVNLIASMVHESIPVVGVVLAGIVLIVGHVFNLGINALGAFIHSGRLQFVEFFPKFLEGGGIAFRPFGRIGKYVDNPKDFIS